MWVRFDQDWDWWVSPRSLRAFKKGTQENVPRRCFQEAVDAGVKVVALEKRKKSEDG